MPALPAPSGRVRAPMPPASSLSQTYGYGEGFAPPHGLGLQSHGPARTCSTSTTRSSTIVAVSTQPQNVEVSLAGGSTDQDTMTQGREYHQVFSTTTGMRRLLLSAPIISCSESNEHLKAGHTLNCSFICFKSRSKAAKDFRRLPYIRTCKV